MHTYADNILYAQIKEDTSQGQEYLEAIRAEALDTLGYFLLPSELFSEMAKRGNGDGRSKFILDDLTKVFNNIAQSTMGTDSVHRKYRQWCWYNPKGGKFMFQLILRGHNDQR